MNKRLHLAPSARGRFARMAILGLVLLAAAAMLQGCGRKGSPERPEGSEFPRDYPYYKKN